MTAFLCGIEFEYLLIDAAGKTPGRVRDFGNLAFPAIAAILAAPPGADDPRLATGDLGIKRGYWYPEGDERFHADGRFRTLEVKGVEIRTPPAASVPEALAALLRIEEELAGRLGAHGLGLAIAAANPRRAAYRFAPPLNGWETALRAAHHAYDAAHISTLSYGPDINLSLPGQSARAALEMARKLDHYAPWLAPFSFCSPFHAGRRWPGASWRTFHRAPARPAVKLFLAPEDRHRHASRLVHPARQPNEAGRIEFKAFDAQPSADILAALCHLLIGVCLAPGLPGRGETPDTLLYCRAARQGFHNEEIRGGSRRLLDTAASALERAGYRGDTLAPLDKLIAARATPADELLAQWQAGGAMVFIGGLREERKARGFFQEARLSARSGVAPARSSAVKQTPLRHARFRPGNDPAR
ncbi:MAG: hypothetical protein LBF61_05410 [Azoarcus sp.]|jgi:hypothetical protein|nr:hypothetical protein [Azoarcus sp.]